MLLRIERHYRRALCKPIALQEIETELVVLLEDLGSKRTCTADEKVVVVKSKLRKYLLPEEAPEGRDAEMLLEKAVDGHEKVQQGVNDWSLLLHSLLDSCKQLVVEKWDSHEDGDMTLLQVVQHPRDYYSMPEEALGSVLYGFEKYCGTAVAVMKWKQRIERIVLSTAHSRCNKICVGDDVPVAEHCSLLVSGRSACKEQGSKLPVADPETVSQLLRRGLEDIEDPIEMSSESHHSLEGPEPLILLIHLLYHIEVCQDIAAICKG